MEARHGRALSWREKRELTDIELELREDAKLDRALSTMRLGRFFRLRRERRRDRKHEEPWRWA